jgi:hypothetical protein
MKHDRTAKKRSRKNPYTVRSHRADLYEDANHQLFWKQQGEFEKVPTQLNGSECVCMVQVRPHGTTVLLSSDRVEVIKRNGSAFTTTSAKLGLAWRDPWEMYVNETNRHVLIVILKAESFVTLCLNTEEVEWAVAERTIEDAELACVSASKDVVRCEYWRIGFRRLCAMAPHISLDNYIDIDYPEDGKSHSDANLFKSLQPKVET